MLTVSTISKTGVAAAVKTSFHEPADVVVFPVAEPARITRVTAVNDDVLAGVELGEVEEFWYDSTDGARVQGWVIKPPDFDPSAKYPMVLHIHGGPHAMYNVGFNNSFQNFAANGYLLLYTNPRGSTGYGTDFGNAIDNGYPSVDYDDLMAGVDALIARGNVDETRMAVTGCSGGGVLSSWVIGQTNRFASAAVRCPVVNWMSFAGTADIPRWGFMRYHGFPWDNAEKYLEHSSLMYVDRVTTPTLLMTGELDLRTPMSQTEEYYQALKAVGVPTELVRFYDEYHGTSSQPSNFIPHPALHAGLVRPLRPGGPGDERPMSTARLPAAAWIVVAAVVGFGAGAAVFGSGQAVAPGTWKSPSGTEIRLLLTEANLGGGEVEIGEITFPPGTNSATTFTAPPRSSTSSRGNWNTW